MKPGSRRLFTTGFVLAAVATIAPMSATARGLRGSGGFTGYHFVRPSVTNRGSYVWPHYQTNPNGTKLDNWSTRGNVNPFTGRPGTKSPY